MDKFIDWIYNFDGAITEFVQGIYPGDGILGKFTDCPIASTFDGSIEDCINDFTKGLKIPVIYDVCYGHVDHSQIIPLGIKVKMISSPKQCSISW
jgi:muramoyltetrapeptide carboxypeptidase LdcA involved in peptidoglycan recycling